MSMHALMKLVGGLLKSSNGYIRSDVLSVCSRPQLWAVSCPMVAARAAAPGHESGNPTETLFRLNPLQVTVARPQMLAGASMRFELPPTAIIVYGRNSGGLCVVRTRLNGS